MGNHASKVAAGCPVEAFSIDELAASLHVCPKTLYRAVERGELKAYRIGRAIRVSLAQLNEYLGVDDG